MKRVSVDLDGTLHRYSQGWTGYAPEDSPTDGARDALARLVDAGFSVVVSTCRVERDGTGTKEVGAWLARHGMEDLVDAVTREKVSASAYVDDRAVPFAGDWDAAVAGVMTLGAKPHGNPWL